MKYVLILVILLGGCAQWQQQRAELFAPEGLPSNKAVFSKNYSEALKAIDKGSATPAEVVAKQRIDEVICEKEK